MPTATKPAFMVAYNEAKELLIDPAIGINKPEALIRAMVLSAMNDFRIRYGRPPSRLSIPVALEAALEVDRGRNLGQPSCTHGKMRESERIFDCPVIWDAREFRIE